VNKRLLSLVAIASILGAVVALISTHQYFRILTQGLEQESFCAISEFINCDTATASSYSTFLHIPVAWFGFLTYLIITGFSFVCIFSSKKRVETAAMAWFLSILAILYSIRMAYVLAFILKVICVECVVLYLINIINFIVLWKVLNVPIKKTVLFFVDYIKAIFKKTNLDFSPKFITHTIVIIFVFVVGWLLMYNKVLAFKQNEGISLKQKVDAHYIQSLYDIKVKPDWPMWGTKGAPVTIIEFSEFQCPFCKLSAFNFKPYLREFKKDVQYYFVNYPLDNSCNVFMDHQMHPKACMEAMASVCVNKLGGDFWGFHDDLFRDQKNITSENMEKLALKYGIDKTKFNECLNSDEIKKQIADDVETANSIYIKGVPAIFINGRKLKYWRDTDLLREAIRKEIKESKKQ